jgi:hypothetical protein
MSLALRLRSPQTFRTRVGPLDEQMKRIEKDEVSVADTRVRMGSAVDQILNTSEKIDAGLIVVGRKGLGGEHRQAVRAEGPLVQFYPRMLRSSRETAPWGLRVRAEELKAPLGSRCEVKLPVDEGADGIDGIALIPAARETGVPALISVGSLGPGRVSRAGWEHLNHGREGGRADPDLPTFARLTGVVYDGAVLVRPRAIPQSGPQPRA